ncbi:FAD/NAD(P)-binding domain-containing protein [Auriculariales sp. MPI-PUGE-AT-0066]|nr:FAD/NAD(P)-binding domain-containing protein [Auriculariales sp. MPI-PUGE-AT-0066]
MLQLCFIGLTLALAANASPVYQQPLILPPHAVATKRVGIIGMGAGGITAMRAIMSLPEEMRRGWEVVAFDELSAVGGLWVPDDTPAAPPALPKTPLYPGLKTNTAHPSMTAPNVTYPPETPFLAPRAAVLKYWQDYNAATELAPHTQVLLKHHVERAEWIGDADSGHWRLSVRNLSHSNTSSSTFTFDHLIVAPGITRYPRIIHLEGQEEWLNTEKTITHSLWYRLPEEFTGQTVVVVGGGFSGHDISGRIAGAAKKVYWSRTVGEGAGTLPLPLPEGVEGVPRIANLHNGIVTLQDGTELSDVTSILLATGYEIRMPFLAASGLIEDAYGAAPPDRLSTSTNYVHPLYEHSLSLDHRYPLGALYFISLMTYNARGSTNTGQALFAAYTMADPTLLDTRDNYYAALKRREAAVRAEGYDPARIGHRPGIGYGPLFGHLGDGPHQDLLVHALRSRRPELAGYPGIPPFGINFTEQWRAYGIDHFMDVLEGWNYGTRTYGAQWEKDMVSGQRTEADYVETFHRFVDWWQHEKVTSTNTV